MTANEPLEIVAEGKEFQTRRLAFLEGHQQIDIAIGPRRALNTRAEQLQSGDVILSAQCG